MSAAASDSCTPVKEEPRPFPRELQTRPNTSCAHHHPHGVPAASEGNGGLSHTLPHFVATLCQRVSEASYHLCFTEMETEAQGKE